MEACKEMAYRAHHWQSTVDRNAYVLARSRGRSVLHVGCASWPFSAELVASGTLLHGRLEQVATRLVGVDTSEVGLNHLRQAGFADLHLVQPDEPLDSYVRQGEFDVVVAGEVLEHVGNAERFLVGIRSVCTPVTDVVITTPNFASILRNLRLLRGIERVHPDHMYYYSPSTLERLLSRAGFRITDQAMYWNTAGRSAPLARALSRIDRLALLADGLCATARPVA